MATDGTLGPGRPLTGPDFVISDDLGRQVGGNLFHSFSDFNVRRGETATFTGPSTVDNVISRVTGGSPSAIDGLIRSEIPAANLFLLNPSGVMFGPDARLDVGGAFHVSTADVLRLADGGSFNATQPADSLLSAAPPSAFGFLDDSPAPIAVDGGQLLVSPDATLSLIGGDITVGRGATLAAYGGRIDIASVASAGEVVPDPGGAPDLRLDAFAELGTIRVSDGADIDAGGDGGGTVFIRGGQFFVDDAGVRASARSSPAGSEVADPGLGLDIRVTGELVAEHDAYLQANVLEGARADVGGVRIQAGRLEVANYSVVQSHVLAGSQGGRGGDVEVRADSVLLRDVGWIAANTGGPGDGGNIRIEAESLELRDGAAIFSRVTDAGSGAGGDIGITSDRVLLSSAVLLGNNADPREQLRGFTLIQTGTDNSTTGRAGNVTIDADTIELRGPANVEVSATTRNSQPGGDVDIRARRVSISGPSDAQVFSGFFANTCAAFAVACGDGRGGSLRVNAYELELLNRGALQASTYGRGDAGAVEVNVTGDLLIRDGSFIASSGLYGMGGDAGRVTVTADRIFMLGGEDSPDPFGNDFTGISGAAGRAGGRGADIDITARELQLAERASIASITEGAGAGGRVRIAVESLEVLGGANILGSTFGPGSGGDVEVVAERVLVAGVNPDPYTDGVSGEVALAPSGIGSQTAGSGNAGAVRVSAETVEVLDGARLTTETFGAGDGGPIEVTAGRLRIAGVNDDFRQFLPPGDEEFAGAAIVANSGRARSAEAMGDAGVIQIAAAELEVDAGGFISSATFTPGQGSDVHIVTDRLRLAGDGFISATSSVSATAGKAGDISIEASEMVELDGGRITTAAEMAEGGTIIIRAPGVRLQNDSTISAESQGAGDAGEIAFVGVESLLSERSRITTAARNADGGNISVDGRGRVELRDSELSATVGGGRETVGGNVRIERPDVVVLNRGDVVAEAFEGTGGDIDIAAGAFLPSAGSRVSASSDLGVSGTVAINAPERNIVADLVPLPATFLAGAELLAQRCAVAGEERSSFLVRGPDGLPPGPDGLLPAQPEGGRCP